MNRYYTKPVLSRIYNNPYYQTYIKGFTRDRKFAALMITKEEAVNVIGHMEDGKPFKLNEDYYVMQEVEDSSNRKRNKYVKVSKGLFYESYIKLL